MQNKKVKAVLVIPVPKKNRNKWSTQYFNKAKEYLIEVEIPLEKVAVFYGTSKTDVFFDFFYETFPTKLKEFKIIGGPKNSRISCCAYEFSSAVNQIQWPENFTHCDPKNNNAELETLEKNDAAMIMINPTSFLKQKRTPIYGQCLFFSTSKNRKDFRLEEAITLFKQNYAVVKLNAPKEKKIQTLKNTNK